MVPKKALMSERQLPSDLEEEILVRVPPLSLVRFRSVCKGWNTLFNDKRFVERNFACGRPEILLKTHSHLYSVSVDLNKDEPTIKVTDLRSDFRLGRFHHQGTCDGYYLFTYDMDEEYRCLVWNPFLNRAIWISTDETDGYIGGRWMGYDGSRPEKVYKIIGIWNSFELSPEFTTRFAVLSDIATNAWKVFNHTRFEKEEKMLEESESFRVCLNRNPNA
ncbi:PREDICTED: putative F-box protein At1g58090 [Camelina sativa]|uniref:F-box protein At1g58090 n=1 Tax=Camelina sativa TaxID=90675 RepID=A0ABM0T0G2_CAMSA|nr:PREDICTED: putative F-box protein At1g58090 [Camelina sativa]